MRGLVPVRSSCVGLVVYVSIVCEQVYGLCETVYGECDVFKHLNGIREAWEVEDTEQGVCGCVLHGTRRRFPCYIAFVL